MLNSRLGGGGVSFYQRLYFDTHRNATFKIYQHWAFGCCFLSNKSPRTDLGVIPPVIPPIDDLWKRTRICDVRDTADSVKSVVWNTTDLKSVEFRTMRATKISLQISSDGVNARPVGEYTTSDTGHAESVLPRAAWDFAYSSSVLTILRLSLENRDPGKADLRKKP
jgi:hypothetical protein